MIVIMKADARSQLVHAAPQPCRSHTECISKDSQPVSVARTRLAVSVRGHCSRRNFFVLRLERATMKGQALRQTRRLDVSTERDFEATREHRVHWTRAHPERRQGADCTSGHWGLPLRLRTRLRWPFLAVRIKSAGVSLMCKWIVSCCSSLIQQPPRIELDGKHTTLHVHCVTKCNGKESSTIPHVSSHRRRSSIVLMCSTAGNGMPHSLLLRC